MCRYSVPLQCAVLLNTYKCRIPLDDTHWPFLLNIVPCQKANLTPLILVVERKREYYLRFVSKDISNRKGPGTRPSPLVLYNAAVQYIRLAGEADRSRG